jgi:spore maturation protein SpmA
MAAPQRPSAINVVWLLLVLSAVVWAAWAGTMEAATDGAFAAAKDAVTLAMGLVGALALWLGVVRVAEEAGLMRAIARGLRPVMRRLFPDVPDGHPAHSAMVLNLAANALGLGNAATPLGLKAMMELDRLNRQPGTATDAMCLFLAINTSSVTLVPVTVMAVRAGAGASSPGAILVPTLLATLCSTAVAIATAKLLARRRPLVRPTGAAGGHEEAPPPAGAEVFGAASAGGAPQDASDGGEGSADAPDRGRRPGWVGRGLVWLLVLAVVAALPARIAAGEDPTALLAEVGRAWLVPLLLAGLLTYGWLRGVRVYEAAAAGAKEGFAVAVRIIPFLVVIFVAIGMFRASGALGAATTALAPVTDPLGLPPDVLPLALLRPLSGSASLAWMTDVVRQAPDGFSAYLASTMQGATDTTFYLLAVYFGAVSVTRTRHALPAALLADATGVAAAVGFAHALF